MKKKTTCSNAEEFDKRINELMERRRTEIEALKKILMAFENKEVKEETNMKPKK